MSDNRFEPIYKAHAIVEMVVFFEFAHGLDGNMDRLLPLRSEMEDDFPRSNLLQAVEIVFPPNQQQASQETRRIDGIELQRFKRDGTFEWLIRITSRSISVHCLEYTRWGYIWPTINRYISTIFGKLAGTNAVLSGVGLKYVDQFVYQGEVKSYDLSRLFKRDTSLLHPRAFSSGTSWHCNCGWFQDMEGLGKILCQMNITGIAQDEQCGIVVIDQTSVYHSQGEDTLLETCLSSDRLGEDTRSQVIEKMHTDNKHILSELLVDEVQTRISLYVEETS
jgi:uncharacterized protein (TIGR04255 family)